MANQVKVAAKAFSLDEILGTTDAQGDEAITAASGSYLTTAEKTELYADLTPLHVHAIGERTSYRWQKPEWVLKVTVDDDETERLLTFEKGSAVRDGQISRMQIHLKSPASRDTEGHAIPITVALVRDETKRAKPWMFGKPATD